MDHKKIFPEFPRENGYQQESVRFEAKTFFRELLVLLGRGVPKEEAIDQLKKNILGPGEFREKVLKDFDLLCKTRGKEIRGAIKARGSVSKIKDKEPAKADAGSEPQPAPRSVHDPLHIPRHEEPPGRHL